MGAYNTVLYHEGVSTPRIIGIIYIKYVKVALSPYSFHNGSSFLRRHSNISVGVAIGVVDREMVQRYITDGVRPVIMYLIRRQAVPRILTAKSYIYILT